MSTRKRKVTIELEFSWNGEIKAMDEALHKAQRSLAKEEDFDSVNELSFMRAKLRPYLPEAKITPVAETPEGK